MYCYLSTYSQLLCVVVGTVCSLSQPERTNGWMISHNGRYALFMVALSKCQNVVTNLELSSRELHTITLTCRCHITGANLVH